MKKINKANNQATALDKTIQILKLVSDVQNFEDSIESISHMQHSNSSAYALSDDELMDVAGGLQDDIPFSANLTDKDKD